MVQMTDKKPGAEIDLLDLLLKIVLVLKANFLWIVGFFVLGLLIGVAYFFTSQKVFENKMIISSSILTTSYSKILFDNVNRHLAEGNVSIVASQLNISEAYAEAISSIKSQGLSQESDRELKEADRLLITVDVTNPQILPDLQKGLLNYLENNEYVKVRVEQNRSYHKQMISIVTQEINDLQEFKNSISTGEFFQRARGNVMFDPTTVNSKIVDLTDKKVQYENSLQLINSVQLVEGFAKFEKESEPKLLVSMMSGSIIGLVIISAIIVLKGINKLVSLAEKSNKS